MQQGLCEITITNYSVNQESSVIASSFLLMKDKGVYFKFHVQASHLLDYVLKYRIVCYRGRLWDYCIICRIIIICICIICTSRSK